MQSNLELAVIGNCAINALIDSRARIVWSCFPRFDGDPVFCALLNNGGEDEKGFHEIELLGCKSTTQEYRRNSAIVITTLMDDNGNAIEVTDFAPRFKNFGRVFRPTMLVRHIRVITGTPRICIRLRPSCEHGSRKPDRTRGSNHIRYVMPDDTLRLTTDAPISYVFDETPFILEKNITLILGPDESLTDTVRHVGREFYERTNEYWLEWCRYLSLPFEWQDAVIRAAITLKLSNFEESGAIIAAATTSIPEAADSERNWDYRFCWLRDSYFVVHALNRLGVTRTMEGYLTYISNIVAATEDGYLQPVFGITQETELDERQIDTLKGYNNMGPVRVGNGAYTQVQNDGYGSVILACAQTFFDQRLSKPGDATLLKRLERLGEQAVKRWDAPDAGLWELRTRQEVHTFSSMMCWAACDRLARICERLKQTDRAAYWRNHADLIRAGILERAWNAELNSFTDAFGGEHPDASLLLMCELGFLPSDDPRFLGTLAFVELKLRRGPYLYRYNRPDDFGMPETSFNICTFWYIDALAAVGRVEEARDLFENMLACRNPMGLLSEDVDPDTRRLWGNFPQTYSMVGLINSATRLSRSWESAF
ncbi:MAG: glycoside hydrolase family 15 protein [Rhodospirillaceae bacterium]|jgi:pentatricopeptide repeat protein|nr:glycoside hydrolase family 15 protein [Rhodospirillaceae bacterium]